MTQGIFYIIRVFLYLFLPFPTSKSLSLFYSSTCTGIKNLYSISVQSFVLTANFSRRLKLEKQSREIRAVSECISAYALIAKSERAENAENTNANNRVVYFQLRCCELFSFSPFFSFLSFFFPSPLLSFSLFLFSFSLFASHCEEHSAPKWELIT